MAEADSEPLAIVGRSCRLPGGARSPELLWTKLASGYSAWSPMPRDRFDAEAFFHPSPDVAGSFIAKGAHFLDEDVALFDAAFFGISANEAIALDPQIRLQLELSYEALENSGLGLADAGGSKIGVFAGGSLSDYNLQMSQDYSTAPRLLMLGYEPTMLANRLSYAFDFKGPSLTVETACSSSMTALHLACQSLKAGDCTAAVVTSSHLNLSPDGFLHTSSMGLLSESGRSFAFDNRATGGYGRGEGAVAIVVKPLRLAIEDGDYIHAVIKNTGINQDGKTVGITRPSDAAQMELLRKVHARAGLDPTDSRVVEMHGTGTRVGDPIECSAVGNACGNHEDSSPVYIGSIKSNIGHLEGAAALAGILKAVMMLDRGFLLPNCDFKTPNENIPFKKLNLEIMTRLIPWPGNVRQRVCVNSFGFGGSNGVAILEKHVPDNAGAGGLARPSRKSWRRRRLYIWSANDRAALGKQLARLVAYLRENPEKTSDDFMADLSFSLSRRINTSPFRIATHAIGKGDLTSSLAGMVPALEPCHSTIRLGFVFPGQGTQWARMGMTLMSYPAYADAIAKADTTLRRLGADWSLVEEIGRDENTSKLKNAAISQPACTSVQVALVDLLESWNICPSAVTGHSSGAIAAAYAAKILDFDSCITIAYYRGHAVSKMKVEHPDLRGAMLAVSCGEADARRILADRGITTATVACLNSPTSMTISGDLQAIEKFQAAASEEGLQCKRLNVDSAYHSHHMTLAAAQYKACLSTESISPAGSTHIAYYSSLTGERSDPVKLDITYWVENLVKPVQFSSSLAAMCRNSTVHCLVEVGLHPALKVPIRQTLATMTDLQARPNYVASLARHTDDTTAMFELTSALFSLGSHVDISAMNMSGSEGRQPKMIGDLPPYPWNHDTRYWHSSRIAQNFNYPQYFESDLLGSKLPVSNDIEPTWRKVINTDHFPWLKDHKIHGMATMPLAAFMTLALNAKVQHAIAKGSEVLSVVLREVDATTALTIPYSTDIEIQVSLRPSSHVSHGDKNDWDEFRVTSWTKDKGWIQHCRGLIATRNDDIEIEDSDAFVIEGQGAVNFQSIPSLCPKEIDKENIYNMLDSVGFHFGPSFRCASDFRCGENYAIAKLTVPDAQADMPFGREKAGVLHPRILDSSSHLLWSLISDGGKGIDKVWMPTFLKQISISTKHLYSAGEELLNVGVWKLYDSFIPTSTGSYALLDPKHPRRPLIFAKGLTLRGLGTSDAPTTSRTQRLYYKMSWREYLPLLPYHEYTSLFGVPQSSKGYGVLSRRIEDVSSSVVEGALKRVSLGDLKSAGLRGIYLSLKERAISQPIKDASNQVYPSDLRRVTDVANTMCRDPLESFVCKVGRNLAGLLCGKLDAAPFAMQAEWINSHHDDFELFQSTRQVIAKYIGHLTCQNPGLRVLEIAAGSGATTIAVMDAIAGLKEEGAGFSKYVVTEVTKTALDRVKSRLKHFGAALEFDVLDVTTDLGEAKTNFEDFDAVIIGCTVQFTNTMRTILPKVKAFLRPGGHLALGAILRTKSNVFELMTLPMRLSSALDDNSSIDTGSTGHSKAHCSAELAGDLQRAGFTGIDGLVESSQMSPGQDYGAVFSTVRMDETARTTGEILIICHDTQPCEHLQRLKASVEEYSGTPCRYISWGDAVMETLVDKTCIVLDGPNQCLLADLNEKTHAVLKRLFCAARIFWLSEKGLHIEPDFSLIDGLARTIRFEQKSIEFITLAMETHGQSWSPSNYELISQLFCHTLMQRNNSLNDDEFLIRSDRLFVARLIGDDEVSTYTNDETDDGKLELQSLHQANRPLQMTITTPGALDTVHFEEINLGPELGVDEVEIDVKAAGVNFRDVLVALGRVPDNALGGECAGIITRVGSAVTSLVVGDRVCACARNTFATVARTQAACAVRFPHHLSFEEAAVIPVIFCTAYRALIEVARLKAKETVLIHAAAGGLGQAAMMIAQSVGAEVYATVGSPEKVDLLHSQYGLPYDHIFNSRSTAFAAQVRKATGYRGVDVVLNSLAGELLQVSWDCVAPFGRFIEVGKKDILSNSRLEMARFQQNVSFSAVDLGTITTDHPAMLHELLTNVMRLFEQKLVRIPLPVTSCRIAEAASMFRKLGSGQTSGKVVLTLSADNEIMARRPSSKDLLFRPDATYLVVGGTGGLGRSLCRWMVANGAGHLLVVSRRGAVQHASQMVFDELREAGAKIHVAACDITVESQLKELILASSNTMPPIRGMIHAAMVVAASVFSNSTMQTWADATRVKTVGIWNLHHCLRSNQLDFFIMLSSIAGIVATGGQSAYCAANTFLDAFAQYRLKRGLPATTIDVGVVGEVGFFAESTTVRADTAADWTGGYLMDAAELCALIKAAVLGKIERSCDGQVITGLAPKREYSWMHNARFTHIRASYEKTAAPSDTRPPDTIREQLKRAISREEKESLALDALSEKLASLLNIPKHTIIPEKSVISLGLDSLVAIEARQWLAKELELTITVLELLELSSLNTLAKLVVAKTDL